MPGNRAAKTGIVALVLLLAAGLGVWMERVSLLAWLQVRGLAHAGDGDRSRWIDRVVKLGEPAVSPLVGLLACKEEQPCRNVRAALAALIGQWGFDDPRTSELVHRLTSEFGDFSDAGRANVLQLATDWASPSANRAEQAAPKLPLRTALAGLAAAAVGQTEEVCLGALDLCTALAGPTGTDETLIPARPLICSCLQAESPRLRARAVTLAAANGLSLLEHAVPLLRDPDAEVRRAAILVIGPADRLVRDESLLPCLHDPDPEVRRLCEMALVGRGLRPEHVKLGRLLTDPKPAVRLQVLDHLLEAEDLDAGLWLRRLSHDPSPSVRAGAVRAMGQLVQLELSDRIEQMGRDDPSPTVAALARFYLARASSEGNR